MKSVINILGICVLRDIFGMHVNDGDYQIGQFVQSVSPVSAVSKCMLQKDIQQEDDIIQDTFQDMSNFYRRNITLDMKKEVFTYLSEVVSDYLMIDAGTCRYDLLKYGGGYLSIVFEEKIRKLIKNGYLPEQAEKIQLDEIEDDIFSNYMDLFIEQILKLYHKEQIILVDCQPVPCFVSQAGDSVNFFEYKTIEKWHKNINRGYRYLRKNLVGCHVIEFPKGIVGDEGHKWGNASLHYIPEYYEYALQVVDIITQEKLPYVEECEKLRDLKEQYEDLMK